jgi:hypothetical protein
MPHRFQPIPADLDLAETALERAPQCPAETAGRAHNPKVTEFEARLRCAAKALQIAELSPAQNCLPTISCGGVVEKAMGSMRFTVSS